MLRLFRDPRRSGTRCYQGVTQPRAQLGCHVSKTHLGCFRQPLHPPKTRNRTSSMTRILNTPMAHGQSISWGQNSQHLQSAPGPNKPSAFLLAPGIHLAPQGAPPSPGLPAASHRLLPTVLMAILPSDGNISHCTLQGRDWMRVHLHRLWKTPWQDFHLSRAAFSLVFSCNYVLPRSLLDKNGLFPIPGSACS